VFNLTPKNKRRLMTVGRWLLPLVASGVASAFIGWGSVQYAKGGDAQRLTTVERDVQAVRDDVSKARAEHSEFVRRDAFQILIDDIREIKSDVREIRDRTPPGVAPK